MEQDNQQYKYKIVNIKQILPKYFQEYQKDLFQTQKAVIFEINSKEGSRILKSLKNKLDVYADEYQIDFLKRFRGSSNNKSKLQFLFCLQDHFEKFSQETQFENIFKNDLNIQEYQIIMDIEVPRKKPINLEQHSKLNKIWPCKLIDEEKMYKQVFKNEQQINNHINLMQQCIDNNKCILVDPTQNNKILVEQQILENQEDKVNQHITMKIMDKLGNFIQESQEKEKIEKKVKTNENNEQNQKNNQYYLATGLDYYIIDEPCIMCSMALIHSRIKRLFLVNQHQIKEKGGIFNTQIFHMDSLNHKFAVFQCEMQQQQQQQLQQSQQQQQL